MEQTKSKARIVYDNHIDWICILAGRWADEKDYEDINEYKSVIQSKIPEIEILAMHKRPFGFTAKIEGKTYKFFVKSSCAGYQQISN